MKKIDLPAFHTHFIKFGWVGTSENIWKLQNKQNRFPQNIENILCINIGLKKCQNAQILMKIGFDHTKMKPRTSGIQFWPRKPPKYPKIDPKYHKIH